MQTTLHPSTVVLLADTGALSNEGLVAVLTELEGLTVIGCAQEPAKVLVVIERVRPDVVILDFPVPGEQALKLIRCIRAGWPDLMLIVLSHYGMLPIRQSCTQAGASLCFEKSTELTDLIETLERLPHPTSS